MNCTYNQVNVNVGIISKPGKISSTTDTQHENFQVVNLYIFVNNQAEIGAQIISPNSPTPGRINDA